MLRRLAHWVLRHELAQLRAEIGALELLVAQWKHWALAQERYRAEVHAEGPMHEGFRAWFFEHVEPLRAHLRD